MFMKINRLQAKLTFGGSDWLKGKALANSNFILTSHVEPEALGIRGITCVRVFIGSTPPKQADDIKLRSRFVPTAKKRQKSMNFNYS